MHQFHIKKRAEYAGKEKRIVTLYAIILIYTHVLHTCNFGEMCILQPEVLLQFACAICMGLHMLCSSHTCTLLIIPSRLTYCHNSESSTNKYFPRFCRSYHTRY